MLPEVAVSELPAGTARSWPSLVAADAAAPAAVVCVADSPTKPSAASDPSAEAGVAVVAAVAGAGPRAASFGAFFVLMPPSCRWTSPGLTRPRRGSPSGAGPYTWTGRWRQGPRRRNVAAEPPVGPDRAGPDPRAPARPAFRGRLLIPATGDTASGCAAALAVGYPHADFDAEVEEHPVDDPRLSGTWGPVIYRIVLTARRPAREGSARLEITAARRIRNVS